MYSLQALSLACIAAAAAVPPAVAQRACPAGQPCILAVYNQRANLVVEWNDTAKRDHYNVRWSRPGKGAVQVKRPGGRGGHFVLKNFHANTKYTFAVQGCSKPLIGSSTCTAWNAEVVTSCGARATPCRE